MTYDEIGIGYDSTRRPDRRIAERLLALLEPRAGGHYLDAACGTGNYASSLHALGLDVVSPGPRRNSQHLPSSWLPWASARPSCDATSSTITLVRPLRQRASRSRTAPPPPALQPCVHGIGREGIGGAARVRANR
jgi:hypothetical protein